MSLECRTSTSQAHVEAGIAEDECAIRAATKPDSRGAVRRSSPLKAFLQAIVAGVEILTCASARQCCRCRATILSAQKPNAVARVACLFCFVVAPMAEGHGSPRGGHRHTCYVSGYGRSRPFASCRHSRPLAAGVRLKSKRRVASPLERVACRCLHQMVRTASKLCLCWHRSRWPTKSGLSPLWPRARLETGAG